MFGSKFAVLQEEALSSTLIAEMERFLDFENKLIGSGATPQKLRRPDLLWGCPDPINFITEEAFLFKFYVNR